MTDVTEYELALAQVLQHLQRALDELDRGKKTKKVNDLAIRLEKILIEIESEIPPEGYMCP